VKLFLEHRISCIPIIDAASKPVGILSWRDVLRTLPTS
jgi:acetoin utilization protein AcuB